MSDSGFISREPPTYDVKKRHFEILSMKIKAWLANIKYGAVLSTSCHWTVSQSTAATNDLTGAKKDPTWGKTTLYQENSWSDYGVQNSRMINKTLQNQYSDLSGQSSKSQQLGADPHRQAARWCDGQGENRWQPVKSWAQLEERPTGFNCWNVSLRGQMWNTMCSKNMVQSYYKQNTMTTLLWWLLYLQSSLVRTYDQLQ